jgi:hypothetical protein
MAEPRKVVLTPGGVRDLVSAVLTEYPAYRDAFLANPAAALERHLGVVLHTPAVVAVADTSDTVHIVIPADPDELGEADLRRVAGGIANTLSGQDDSAQAVTRIESITFKQTTRDS